MFGSMHGHAAMVEMLLKHKANADLQDEVGNSPTQHPRALS